MDDEVICRPEQPGDEQPVRMVVSAAFGREQVADLVDDLRAGPDWLREQSHVAQDAVGIIGHVGVSRALLDTRARLVDIAVLSPLSVVPAHQGNGVGGALIDAAVRALDVQGCPMVVLEGSPSYYSRFGFSAAGECGLRRPSVRIPAQAFQVRRLAAYEPWMTGTVVYARAFWDHDSVGLRDPDLARMEQLS